MKKFRKIIKITGYFLVITILIIGFKIFIPRNYEISQPEIRTGTLFWNLSTGSKIAYTFLQGKGEIKKYPIIFLQGGPGGRISNRNIQMLLPLAENGYDVYLYDQVGCGLSNRLDNVREYTTERHTIDLNEFIFKTGATKVILIGQSWGAMLATMYLAEHPERVEKIILTGPGPILPIHEELATIPSPDTLNFKKPASTNAAANREAQNFRTKAMAFFAREFGIKLADDKEADEFQTYLSNKTNKSTVCDINKVLESKPGDGFYCQVMTVASFSEAGDVRMKLSKIKTPLLILKGQCDNQSWGYTAEYLELFQNHQLLVIPDAGHSISIEQPELYLQSILDFLNKQ
ncbi:MAG: alpha/beta hydrolase [Bacteroidetes bacterium]|nr:alpha/beta hydrolase [Bacteroidota bacterium]